jgi:membrane protein DedA with SNARE-associated domain
MTAGDFLHALPAHVRVIGETVALFLAPFVHENVAIVTTAILIAAHQLPRWLAIASVYGGMTSSDLALYGLGALARRSPWARRLFLGRGSLRLGNLMRAHLGKTVILARLVPGMIFPTYVACGWIGLPFRRFSVFCLASAAIYLPVTLTLAQAYGRATTEYLGYWAWVGLIVPLIAAGFIGSQVLARRSAVEVRARSRAQPAANARQNGVGAIGEEAGKTQLNPARRAYSRFEFLPGFLFYAPVTLYFFLQAIRHRSLTVPAIANPRMENGGLWGESKSRLFADMGHAGRAWLARYTSLLRGGPQDIDRDTAAIVRLTGDAGIGIPFVAKPDIGCKGNGVRVIRDVPALRKYVEEFPSGARILLQQLAEGEGEAGVFYVRRPGDGVGHISSLTLKFSPFVIGDGLSTMEELIRADRRAGRIAHVYLDRLKDSSSSIPADGQAVQLVFVGNHCKGSIFRDGASIITPALTGRIEQIARTIPDFHYGRFDLRFASLDRLRAGEDFTLIEYNGGGSEATHIWDPDMKLLPAYRDQFRQIRMMFEIGAANRRKGHRAGSAYGILAALRRQNRLMEHYPAHD